MASSSSSSSSSCSVPTILTVDRVAPPPDRPYPPPGPTGPLSFLDTNWIHLPYIQLLLLYPHPPTPLPFSSLVSSIKSSLSQTLLSFHPLAGKLSYLPSSADVIVDCDNAGVDFTVAECDGDIDKRAGDETHDSRAFIGLVPEIEREALPLPVMSVKVTGFSGGGVAVGVEVHHAVVDGNGVMQFLRAWSATCRGEELGGAVPVHDRAVILHPRGQEIARMFLRKKAPELPNLTAYPSSIEGRLRLQRRTFVLSSFAIQSLKQRIINQSDGSDRPSTFTAISAYVWVCIAHVNSLAANADPADVTNLLFLVDCRSRLDPPVPAAYTGNCVRSCHAPSKWAHLLGLRGLSRAHAAIARAVKEAGARDPFEGCESWVESFRRIPSSGRVLISGSPRFSASQTDFGWGKPGRMELVSMNLDGEVVLDGRGDGSVQVSVALEPAQMGVFAQAFKNQLTEREGRLKDSDEQRSALVGKECTFNTGLPANSGVSCHDKGLERHGRVFAQT